MIHTKEGSFVEYRPMTVQKLQSGRWLTWGIRFFLTAALTASQTAGGYAPFALGCIAAAGPGADGAAALLGGVTGALLFLDFQQVLALAAVGILILTAATAFRDTAFLQKPWVLPVLAAGMVLAVDGIYVLQSLDPLSHAAPCAAASALTGVSAHFFTRLFQPEEDRLAPEGLLFLGAALTLALGDLTILNVSVGRVLLCALLAYAAYDQGPMTGVTAGLGLGLITDLSAGTSGLFTAAYGVAGLCAAKCRRRSMAALAFFSGAAAAMLTSREELAQTLLLETVAGSLLFLALPRRIFGGKRLLREAAPDIAQRTALKTHLNRAAEALRELYDSMSRTPPPQEENPAVIFDRAAEKVCRGCALCELCWQKEYTATFNALNDATPYLLERGKAKAKDFPVHFADRCIHLSELLQAINGELSAFLLRKQYRRQLEETRRSAKGQYAQMSDLLTAAAAGLSGAAPAFGEILACVIGAALRPKEGEMVCGDTMEAFRTDSGLLVLVGRSNRQNDKLTAKTAEKTDLWLHTQKIHGSHVILCTRGAEPDEQSILQAAKLAAYFSQGRGSGKVAVDYTPVKYVKKPAGPRPGMVVYTTYRTVLVEPEEDLPRRLAIKYAKKLAIASPARKLVVAIRFPKRENAASPGRSAPSE